MPHSPGMPPRTIVTRLAQMSLTAPGLVEQRFHTGAGLDAEGFEENRRARFELVGDTPHVMLSIFPASMDFNLNVATSDHFGKWKGRDGLKALAVVVRDGATEGIVKLHFAYYPAWFPVRVFGNEAEARTWLLEQRSDLDPGTEEAGL